MNGEYLTDITPLKKTLVVEYTKYKISIPFVYVGENRCDVRVVIATDDERETKMFNYVLEGTDYLLWVADGFLNNWVKAKLAKEVF